MDALGFFIFSTIEGISIYAITLYLFRFNPKKYLAHISAMAVIMSLQSYLFREHLSLSFIVPVGFLICTILFLATVMRIPIIWSAVMSITGYFCFVVLQTTIVAISFGYLAVEEVQNVVLKGYFLQLLTAASMSYIGFRLYRKGLGFTYEFERIRLRWERIIVITLILSLFVVFAAMFFYNEIFINLTVSVICLIGFLFYSFRKEIDQ